MNEGTKMGKWLIEGACDGGLFAETVEAANGAEAVDFAIDRLCEAWGHVREADTTLDDLGDCASVTQYSADDYVRDAAADLLAFVDQVGRLSHSLDPDLIDPVEPQDSSDALDGLILKARKLAAAARGEG